MQSKLQEVPFRETTAASPATFAEIEENDFNLNTSRYVDTFEPEPEVNM